MPQYQIVDLDGCISDDRWRREKILPPQEKGRFALYHQLSHLDHPYNHNELRYDCEWIVITGRPVSVAESTINWFQDYFRRRPAHLIMRNPEDDHMPSVRLKQRNVGWLFEPNLLYGVRKEQIIDAIDDRQDIVEMYRDFYQLPARIVRIGAEEHAHG